MAGLVGHKSWGEAAEGFFFHGLLACPAPFDFGADSSGPGVVSCPIELCRPSGGFAVFVVEVEEGTVVVALAGLGQLGLEKVVESVSGGCVDRDVEGDGFSVTDALIRWVPGGIY